MFFDVFAFYKLNQLYLNGNLQNMQFCSNENTHRNADAL